MPEGRRLKLSRARLQKLNVASPVSRRNRLHVTALDTAADHFISAHRRDRDSVVRILNWSAKGLSGCRLQSSGIAHVVYDHGNFHQLPRQLYLRGYIFHRGSP